MTGRGGFQVRLESRPRVDDHWMASAQCRSARAEFFPKNFNHSQTVQAKQVCRGCPVQDACLAHALKHGERDGIWGGLTPDERKKLSTKSAQPAPHPQRHRCVVCGVEVHGQGRSKYCSSACSRHRRCADCGATFLSGRDYRNRFCKPCRRRRNKAAGIAV